MPALELEVAPLSAPEQRIFLYEKAKELQDPHSPLAQARVEEILSGGGRTPSAIMQSLEDIATDRRPKKRQAELPVKKIQDRAGPGGRRLAGPELPAPVR